MKIYNLQNTPKLRNYLEKQIEEVWGVDNFLDMIDEWGGCSNYDIFRTCDEELYIINRITGYYLNWYKYTHIGRDVHTNMNPKMIKRFLEELLVEYRKCTC